MHQRRLLIGQEKDILFRHTNLVLQILRESDSVFIRKLQGARGLVL